MVNESCTAGFTSNSGLGLSFHGLTFLCQITASVTKRGTLVGLLGSDHYSEILLGGEWSPLCSRSLCIRLLTQKWGLKG